MKIQSHTRRQARTGLVLSTGSWWLDLCNDTALVFWKVSRGWAIGCEGTYHETLKRSYAVNGCELSKTEKYFPTTESWGFRRCHVCLDLQECRLESPFSGRKQNVIIEDDFAPAVINYLRNCATLVWHNWKATAAVNAFQKIPTMVRLDASVLGFA